MIISIETASYLFPKYSASLRAPSRMFSSELAKLNLTALP